MEDPIIDRIKQCLSLKEIMAETAQFNSAGFCLCPFHQEKTPSCKIDTQKNMYYCFSCGKGGDIFSFTQNRYNISFIEAKKMLAEKAGIVYDDRLSSLDQQLRKRILKINQEAAIFFHNCLKKNAKAVSYLRQNRQINQTTIITFYLGYAPQDNSRLYYHLLSLNFTEEELLPSGLFMKKKCRFQERIIFPIYDHRSNCIGFGGRNIEIDNQQDLISWSKTQSAPDFQIPKYINSAQTIVFSKKDSLYGLNMAIECAPNSTLQHNNTSDTKLLLDNMSLDNVELNHVPHGMKTINNLCVVEGYLDVIQMYQYGFCAVAPLGTAINIIQIKLCLRFTNKLVFLFDGDKAGHKASMRALEQAMPIINTERQIYFAQIPDNEDPDSILKKAEGKQIINNSINTALDPSQMIWAKTKLILESPNDDGGYNDDTIKFARAIKFARNLISKITDVDLQSAYRIYLKKQMDLFISLSKSNTTLMTKLNVLPITKNNISTTNDNITSLKVAINNDKWTVSNIEFKNRNLKKTVTMDKTNNNTTLLSNYFQVLIFAMIKHDELFIQENLQKLNQICINLLNNSANIILLQVLTEMLNQKQSKEERLTTLKKTANNILTNYFVLVHPMIRANNDNVQILFDNMIKEMGKINITMIKK